MKTKIFYFSITGNSLYVARAIAGILSETELLSIPKVINAPIESDSDSIGINISSLCMGSPQNGC